MTKTSADTIAYFGYGSLVNLTTLRTPYISAHPARVRGWKREWLARPRDVDGFAPVDGLAFLSVTSDASSEIDGVIIVDHAASLSDLDRRESLYDRRSVSQDDCSFLGEKPFGSETNIFLYEATPDSVVEDEMLPNILRSYLDAVCQGFLSHFGEQGIVDFKASTDNFHFPIREDRTEPLYPRSVLLSADEQQIIDSHFPVSGPTAE